VLLLKFSIVRLEGLVLALTCIAVAPGNLLAEHPTHDGPLCKRGGPLISIMRKEGSGFPSPWGLSKLTSPARRGGFFWPYRKPFPWSAATKAVGKW
jgi:hypothetical protein